MHYVYCLTNKINKKVYIGRSNNIKNRMTQHKNDSKNINCPNKYKTPFAQAIRKYGWENFELSILAESEDAEEINKLEIYYIDLYNAYGDGGYNASTGGEYGFSNRVYISKVGTDRENIYKDLKENILSLDEIGKKYNISTSYVSDINNGTRLRQEDIKYPVRKKECKYFELYPLIIEDLENSDLSMRAISRKYNVGHDVVQKINKGNKTAQSFRKDFPIRK